MTPEGQRIGLTANSFTSVSLEPPLVLWSLKKNSANLDAFRRATHFAVNVLTAGQKDLCFRFASKIDGDRFDGVPLELTQSTERLYASFKSTLRHRSRAEVEALFCGLELVEPGVVYSASWRPDSTRYGSPCSAATASSD